MPRGRKPRKYVAPTENQQPFLLAEHEWGYVDRSVERVKMAWGFHHMMNPDGKKMLLAYSGGKDSTCLFFVCKRASEELGIPMEDMFHVQYNVTNVDPPELYRFIRDVMKKQYPFIEIHHPKKTMWQLIEALGMPPTRIVRYCCAELKEASSEKGGYTLTGVRRAESVKRMYRTEFEIHGKTKEDRILLNDNDVDRRETEFCMQKNAYICNPIIDWSDDDVWHYIKGNNLPYCKLYDEGFHRLGCIGCPIAPPHEREREFARWPGFERCYKRAFKKMLANEGTRRKRRVTWQNEDECFEWWIHGEELMDRGQTEKLFEED